MNKNTKVVVAFVLTLLLVASFPVAAFAETGTITGDSTVDNVVVNVILPTDLNFALDPLGLDTTGENQIATQDFFFVNQTFAPVKVSVDITAQTSGGAVLVATTGGLSLDDTSVTAKKLYFGALGATGVTGASIDTTTVGVSYSAIFGSTTGPAAEYSSVSPAANTLVAMTPNAGGTTGSAVISFALDKAIESATTPDAIDSLAADNKGVAAFQFYSQLNTYADWQDNDITVSGAYTLIPLRTTTYEGYDYVTGSLNQLEPEVVTPPAPTAVGFTTGGSTTSMAINVASITGTTLVIPFNLGSETVTSIKSASGTTVTADQYTVDAANMKITYLETRTTALKNLTVSTYNTITLSGGGTYTINFIK